jgi:hypothetical protein
MGESSSEYWDSYIEDILSVCGVGAASNELIRWIRSLVGSGSRSESIGSTQVGGGNVIL